MDMKQVYTHSDRLFLLKLARESIEISLKGEELSPGPHDSKFDEKRGAFVTLHSGGTLRGCVGYPLPVYPLIDAIINNAASAALQDPRFSPVTRDELSDIDIEISVLTMPRKIESVKEIVVGRDGILVTYGPKRGLLLPQVPVEQKWDLETFLKCGCMKAGLSEDRWKKGAEIEIFQAEIFGEKEL